MTDTYRAMCAELFVKLKEWDSSDPYHDCGPLLCRARALLALDDLTPPMTDQRPINLSEEVLDKWRSEYNLSLGDKKNYAMFMAEKAAQWGANQELEACCEWVRTTHFIDLDGHDALRTARRPKPPSLKERLSKAIIDGDEREALKLLEGLDD